MSRYILAPQAAQDLIHIWRYIKEQSSLTIADRVERTIRDKWASSQAILALDTGGEI